MSRLFFLRLTIVLTSILLTLAVIDRAFWLSERLEILNSEVRITDEHTRVGQNPSLFQYDAYAGWAGIPSLHREYSGNTFTHNSAGMRSPELPRIKSPDRKRLVLLGDSQVYGVGVNDDQTIGACIDQQFGAQGIDAISLGVSGYGIDQSFLQLAGTGVDLQPDFIVFVLFPENDFAETNASQYWAIEKPVLSDETGELCLYNSPPARSVGWPDSRLIDDPTIQPSALISSVSALFPHLTQFVAHREWRDEVIHSLAFGRREDYRRQIDNLQKVLPCNHGIRKPAKTQEDQIRIPLAIFMKIQGIADRIGAPFLVLSKPPGPEAARPEELRGLVASLAASLQEHQIAFIDLGEIFSQKQIPAAELFISNGHLSPLGNREIAQYSGDWALQHLRVPTDMVRYD